MKIVSNNKIEANVVELKFLIPKEAFDAENDKVFKEKSANITIQGFRKGKAPRHMIEKIYGKGVFYEDALNNLLSTEYPTALEESGIKPVDRPEIDVETIDENGVLVVAKITVKPVAEIEGYKGLAVVKETVKVTDKEVDEELKNVQTRQGRLIEVTDRAAQLEDTANIDYDGFVGETAFEGGKGDGYDLKLGSGTFIPGFEEQIVGHTIGEEFDVNVTFPTEYHSEELAGKEAVFKCKLNAIKVTELPDIDDEFAKDVSEFNTLAEYKADLKAKILAKKETEAQNEFERKVIDALVEKVVVDIPSAMITTEVENQVRDFDMNLRQNGLDMKTYFQYTGLTLEAMREQFKPVAEKQIKLRLALESIASKEGFTATEEEFNSEIETLAKSWNVEAEQVRSYIESEDLSLDIVVRKAMDFVKANTKKTRATKKKATADENTENGGDAE